MLPKKDVLKIIIQYDDKNSIDLLYNLIKKVCLSLNYDFLGLILTTNEELNNSGYIVIEIKVRENKTIFTVENLTSNQDETDDLLIYNTNQSNQFMQELKQKIDETLSSRKFQEIEPINFSKNNELSKCIINIEKYNDVITVKSSKIDEILFFEIIIKYKIYYKIRFEDCVINIKRTPLSYYNRTCEIKSIEFENTKFIKNNYNNPILIEEYISYKSCDSSNEMTIYYIKLKENANLNIVDCEFPVLEIHYCGIYLNYKIDSLISLDISDSIFNKGLIIKNNDFKKIEIRDCDIEKHLEISNNKVYKELSIIDGYISNADIIMHANMILNKLKIEIPIFLASKMTIKANYIFKELDLSKLIINDSECDVLLTDNNQFVYFVRQLFIQLYNKILSAFTHAIENIEKREKEVKIIMNYVYSKFIQLIPDTIKERLHYEITNIYPFLKIKFNHDKLSKNEKAFIENHFIKELGEDIYIIQTLVNENDIECKLKLRYANLDNCNLNIKYSIFKSIDLYKSKIAYLEPANFEVIQQLVEAEYSQKKIDKSNKNNPKNEKVKKEKVQVYYMLGLIYKDSEHKKVSNQFKHLSMKVKYQSEKISFLYNFISGYDIYPRRILYFMGYIMIICAIIYFFAGLCYPINNICKSCNIWERIYNALYFSIVSFTTLGLGDLKPQTFLSKTITAIEAFSGMFLIAYYIGIKINKK